MCYGCFIRQVANGGGFARTDNPSEVNNKLYKAAGLDKDLAQEYISKLLMDPDQQDFRKHTEEIDDLYADIRACITSLVFLNTVGPNKTSKWHNDMTAIRVMEQVMSELHASKTTPEDQRKGFAWFYMDEKHREHLTLSNLPYAIIFQMSEIRKFNRDDEELRETISSFFDRPFIKYYVAKNPNHYFIKQIEEQWK